MNSYTYDPVFISLYSDILQTASDAEASSILIDSFFGFLRRHTNALSSHDSITALNEIAQRHCITALKEQGFEVVSSEESSEGEEFSDSSSVICFDTDSPAQDTSQGYQQHQNDNSSTLLSRPQPLEAATSPGAEVGNSGAEVGSTAPTVPSTLPVIKPTRIGNGALITSTPCFDVLSKYKMDLSLIPSILRPFLGGHGGNGRHNHDHHSHPQILQISQTSSSSSSSSSSYPFPLTCNYLWKQSFDEITIQLNVIELGFIFSSMYRLFTNHQRSTTSPIHHLSVSSQYIPVPPQDLTDGKSLPFNHLGCLASTFYQLVSACSGDTSRTSNDTDTISNQPLSSSSDDDKSNSAVINTSNIIQLYSSFIRCLRQQFDCRIFTDEAAANHNILLIGFSGSQDNHDSESSPSGINSITTTPSSSTTTSTAPIFIPCLQKVMYKRIDSDSSPIFWELERCIGSEPLKSSSVANSGPQQHQPDASSSPTQVYSASWYTTLIDILITEKIAYHVGITLDKTRASQAWWDQCFLDDPLQIDTSCIDVQVGFSQLPSNMQSLIRQAMDSQYQSMAGSNTTCSPPNHFTTQSQEKERKKQVFESIIQRNPHLNLDFSQVDLSEDSHDQWSK